jgi:transglutaminase-like putative cysteine protease
MILTVLHRTRYRYARPVLLQPHQLIVTPAESGELTTVSRSLVCDPPASLSWRSDTFGNLIAVATFAQPAVELTIISEAIVDHRSAQWPIFNVDPSAHVYPFAYSLEEVIDLGALAQPDWLKPGGEAVASWARGFVMGPTIDTLSLLKDLNAGVINQISYRSRDEEGTQSPAETLELRTGSCRDIAGLFIEAVRHLGFGARAVSGYLIDLEQADADKGSTHAWADVYLPGVGWIAFDPTHGRVGNGHLIPVAHARRNQQIMPVTGGYVGETSDFSDMDVTVRVTYSQAD